MNVVEQQNCRPTSTVDPSVSAGPADAGTVEQVADRTEQAIEQRLDELAELLEADRAAACEIVSPLPLGLGSFRRSARAIDCAMVETERWWDKENNVVADLVASVG